MSDAYWLGIAATVVITLGSYFFKRLIDSKADTSDVRALIEQLQESRMDLRDHVTSCNERNKQITDSLEVIRERIAKTAEGVAEIRGKLSS